MLWFIWLGGFNMPQLHPNTIKGQIKKCLLERKKNHNISVPFNWQRKLSYV